MCSGVGGGCAGCAGCAGCIEYDPLPVYIFYFLDSTILEWGLTILQYVMYLSVYTEH